MSLINIGFGNIVNTDKIIAMVSPDSSPSKRLIQHAKEQNLIVDASQGRRTRTIIVMESGHVILSALQPDTIAGRTKGMESDSLGSKGEEDE